MKNKKNTGSPVLDRFLWNSAVEKDRGYGFIGLAFSVHSLTHLIEYRAGVEIWGIS
jgi:hypothetical protein